VEFRVKNQVISLQTGLLQLAADVIVRLQQQATSPAHFVLVSGVFKAQQVGNERRITHQ